MIYKVYLSNGQPLVIEAAELLTDPNIGVRLLDEEGNIVAFFYPGQANAVFPESSLVEAEVISGNE